jgi:hypothetical protein
MKKFILEGKVPVEVQDITEWATNFEGGDKRTVCKTNIDKIKISTVFLGLCHNHETYKEDCEHILFETMIFDERDEKDKENKESFDGFQYRYETWVSAELGHKQAVEMVQKSLL